MTTCYVCYSTVEEYGSESPVVCPPCLEEINREYPPERVLKLDEMLTVIFTEMNLPIG